MIFPPLPLSGAGESKDRKVLKICELTRQIKNTLETRFCGLWLEGEVSNFTRAASGHLYFTLKDEESQIRAVMFRGAASSLGFEVASGNKVQAYGDVSVYPPRGEYQLKVTRMQPAGIGDLQLAFEALKKKLGEEGLFDEARKRPIPAMPRRIGVVTSPTGAAIRDILNVATRRFPNISLVLAPCKVQGQGSAQEVADRIELLNETGGFDVLIVGRGGGSLEDLWAFNEEVVARAIAASAIPVISAVGHEIDFTIADFVADLRAPTPSAAAEIAVPDQAELYRRIQELSSRIRRSVTRKFEWLSERHDAVAGRALFRRPMEMIEQYSMRLDELLGRMGSSSRTHMTLKESAFEAMLNRLEPVSPIRTMRRGYSIVTRQDDGQPLTDASACVAGEMLRVRMAQGELSCTVADVSRESARRGEQGLLPLS